MTPRRAAGATDELRASLVAHGAKVVERDGASALTMRALAAEAGCAVGLPYKVFADREELVLAILQSEFDRLASVYDALRARVGSGTVGGNLVWFAEELLASPAVGLAHEVHVDHGLDTAFAAHAHRTGAGPAAWEDVITSYLRAEQRAGRVADDVDPRAFGFLIAGAVHNLIMAGSAWPRPTSRRLEELFAATAKAVAPRA